MRHIFLLLSIVSCCAYSQALTLDEIVRLHEARISDEVIMQLIHTQPLEFQITVQNIIDLKNKGVSDKVLEKLIAKGVVHAEKKQKKAVKPTRAKKARELTPFDQFFLSMYYSNQYGWPEPNYESPREILEQGLFYQPPTRYPHARRIRIYGSGATYQLQSPWTYSISPFSILVPREYVTPDISEDVDAEDAEKDIYITEREEDSRNLGK